LQGLFDDNGGDYDGGFSGPTFSSSFPSKTTSRKWNPSDNLPPAELRKFVRDSQEKLMKGFQNDDVTGGGSSDITADVEKATERGGGKNTESLATFKKKLKKNKKRKAGGGGFGAR